MENKIVSRKYSGIVVEVEQTEMTIPITNTTTRFIEV